METAIAALFVTKAHFLQPFHFQITKITATTPPCKRPFYNVRKERKKTGI
jgi:hypothetical protein